MEVISNRIETKEKEPKKTRVNVGPKAELTEDQLKELVNENYSESNRYFRLIKEAVHNITEKYKRQLDEHIGYADQLLQLSIETDQSTGRKNYTMSFDLSDRDMEFLTVKIPITLLYVQEQINNYALDATIAEYLFEHTLTEKLKGISGGDAKERLRFAQQQADVEQIVSIIKKQVYSNLKSYVDRADKIYEGLKKVLDGKNREKGLFMKTN